MASSGNFAVFSTVTRPESGYSTSDQITGGGLSIKGPSSGSFEPVVATISPNSGKWYWEYRTGQGGGSVYGRPAIATSNQTVVKNEDYNGAQSGQVGVLFQANDGQKRINGSSTSYGNAVSQHDIVQVALDCDNGAVYFGINNTWQNSGDPTSGSSKTGAALTANIQNVDIDILHTRYVGGGIDQYNFGQDDTFGGAITGAGNADGNGFGVFKYAPPTGFLALCSANLPISSDIDPAQTDSEYPSKQFNVVTYTGNGSTQSITGLGFQPDMVWIKSRSSGEDPSIYDSNRGVTKRIKSSANEAESTVSNGFTAFDSDGFSLGSATENNDSGETFVGWSWRCNGGTTASNSEGNITSTVQANTKAGFSIITYTGSGGTVSGANPTFGHGLESVPDFLMFKCRSNGSTNWIVWHSGLGGANKYLNLNASSSAGTDTAWISNTAPSSTLITTDNGGWGAVNGSSRTYVCYAWHSVEGYSKFESYEGNSNADGSFIYTGFRPRILFTKRTENSGGWRVRDTERDTYNPSDTILWWDSGSQEYSNSDYSIDILSNGFKLRTSSNDFNASEKWIYGAWGDVPFKYNNTF